MAGGLVGGAFLSAALQVLFDRMASRSVLDFFRGQKLNAQLLMKLNTKMITINKVFDDADDKQHTDPYVKQWLGEFKDVVYEAEDLLDEIASEVQRSEIEAESQTTVEKMQDCASCYNPFKTGKREKLEEILGKLEYLVEQKDALGLSQIGDTSGKTSYRGKSTSSIPNESFIYGRDTDKEAIMKWVLCDHPNIIKNPDVLAIVGVGGLGKTTLAQHVYRDSKTAGYFDKMAWICVSEEEFDVPKVTKNILEGFTKSSSDANNLDTLQTRLEEVLKGKKFLLVLDDVWSKDYDEWDNLLKPLRSGKEGSKILVTTRNQDVANCIETSPTHQLKKLTDKDCWSLFEKHAFKGAHMSSVHPDLKRIGRQIVKKCGGLPLAAKLLGGGLRSERNPEKWTKILERDMLDVQKYSILPILRLSYRFLPSHLKRCFAYCAVFPQDYEFKKEKLIRLWMAEGLLPQHEDIEQAGEDCFDDLVSRSFFQKSRKSFLMHDLINDLAKSISGEFCFRYGVDRSGEISERIRHLWLSHRGEVDKWAASAPIQHLRTIFLGEWAGEVETWLPTITRVRVLSLRCNKLPDSIGNLVHLRYLDLSYSSSMQRLPDTVTSLCNLETLILYGCGFLVELPATIFKLINLSLLDIRGTNLRKMPPHMGKLKKLGELDYYIVGKERDCSLKELGPLKRLRGYLRIEKLRNVSEVQEVKEASLKSKEKLKELELIWNDEGSEDSLHERNVLEQLRPHTNIEQLSIYGYAGTRFPDWVGDSSFSNMVELKLKRCRYCTSLPALGQLESLKRLSIIGFDGIAVVGPEFYGNSNKPPFGCLESLQFEGMAGWQEWVPYSNMDEGDGATAAFPLLRELQIVNCPKLKEIQPTHHLPSLKYLIIIRCGSLERLPLDSAPALQHLRIEDCPNRKEIQLTHHLPSLTQLSIIHCASLERLLVDSAPAIRYIEIEDCPNLKEIQPTHHLLSLIQFSIISRASLERLLLDSAPALQYLKIKDCHNLKEIQLTHHLPSLRQLIIKGCGSLERFLLDSAPAMQHIRIKNCPNLKEIQTTHLPSLTKLTIRCCGSLEIQTTHLPSLTKLTIRCCGSLERLLLDSAPALQYLEIEDCPNLKEIQLTHHLPSLRQLIIKGCGSLERLLLNSALAMQHIRIEDCPNLKEIQATHLPSLTKLTIKCCGSLERFLLDFVPALKKLKIDGCGNLEFLSGAAGYLKIRFCPNLKEIQSTHVSSLIHLDIWGCDQLVSLPRAPALQSLWFEGASHDVALGYRNSSHSPLEVMEQLMALELKTLTVRGCDSVTSFPLDLFPMLESLLISDCPKLESLSAASQAQPLQHCKSLSLFGCPNLKRFLSMHNCPVSTLVDLLRIFPNLSHLDLFRCCEEVESFPPENMLLPPTLTFLLIHDFPNLKSFRDTALQSLTCLRELRIDHCPKLQSIPKEGLPSSLQLINISGCPSVQLGEDWPFNTYRRW